MSVYDLPSCQTVNRSLLRAVVADDKVSAFDLNGNSPCRDYRPREVGDGRVQLAYVTWVCCDRLPLLGMFAAVREEPQAIQETSPCSLGTQPKY